MKDSDSKKIEYKNKEVDLSQVSADDIARRFLETPPKHKKKEKESK